MTSEILEGEIFGVPTKFRLTNEVKEKVCTIKVEWIQPKIKWNGKHLEVYPPKKQIDEL